MSLHHAMRCLGLAAGVALAGAMPAQSGVPAVQAALDTNNLPSGSSSTTSPDLAPSEVSPAPVEPAPEVIRPRSPGRGAREPRGNPLWAIPLKSLNATRERPIFLPSRRAPAPAVAGPPPPEPMRPPPPPPAEPDRPRLALVGAVAGDAEGIAIFVDETTRGIVRLRTGENHLGWTLRSVRGREATMQKDRQTVLLALPAPTDPSGGLPPVPGLPGMPAVPPMPGVPGASGIPGLSAVPGAVGVPGQPPGKEPEL
jgi:general secretion pathway protein N